MSAHPIDDEQLIAFANDELAGAAATTVAAHLAGCAVCTQTVARFRLVRATVAADERDAPPAATLSRAKALFRARRPATITAPLAALRRVVAQLTFDSRAAFGPALAGVRGAGASAGASYHLAYTSDLADVDLQVDRLANGEAGRWQVLGQVAPTEDVTDASSVRVSLATAGSDVPLVETATDEVGMFVVEALAGRYDVLLQLTNRLLVLAGVQIG